MGYYHRHKKLYFYNTCVFLWLIVDLLYYVFIIKVKITHNNLKSHIRNSRINELETNVLLNG